MLYFLATVGSAGSVDSLGSAGSVAGARTTQKTKTFSRWSVFVFAPPGASRGREPGPSEPGEQPNRDEPVKQHIYGVPGIPRTRVNPGPG